MKSYFAYVRVSTVRQGKQGTSPQEQRHAITGYALRHQLNISDWYQESETAAKQGRPEFNRMLRDIERQRPAGVIIHKIDRSARNLGDWVELLDLVDDGTEVHFAHETVDLRSRGGRLTANIQAVLAADYSRNLSDEVKKGQLGRLRQGIFPSRAPKGYRDTGPGKIKEIDPIAGPLVREAFELYATGEFSIETLRLEMARRGLRQPRGSPLSAGHMGYILHNSFYVGLMRLSTVPETFQGKHEPLVSLALFERVQRVLGGRGSAKIQKHNFVFRLRVRCAACGRFVTGEKQKGHIYYRCHSRSCRGTAAPENELHDSVCDALLYFFLDEGELGDFRDVLQGLIAEERSGERQYRHALARDIAKLDERLSLLTDTLLDGTLDRDTYAGKKEELLLARRSLVEKQEHGETAPFWEGVSSKFEQAFVALPRYFSAIPAEQRDVLDSIGSNFSLSTREPVLTLLSPFAEWVEWTKTQKSWPSQGEVRNGAYFRAFLESLRPAGKKARTSASVARSNSSSQTNPKYHRWPDLL
jgi:DNA invertase Pin-like site-specific DNA recombinase